MALQGTIDDFPLTDVLSLLASSSRSGRLLLDGDRGPATLVIDQGHVVGGGPGTEGADAQQLVFELLRHREGSFGFEAVDPVVEPGQEVGVDPRPVVACIEDAGRLLERWREVEAVVPSPSCPLRLLPELRGDSIELDADDWRLVATVGSGLSVGDLRAQLGIDELSLCERVADLVRTGLLVVDEPGSVEEPVAESAHSGASDPGPARGSIPGSWDESEPAGSADDWADPPKDESSVGWLLAEDDREPAMGPDDGAAEPLPSGVPEHFPIDDLLGEQGAADDDPWASPEMELLEQQRSQPVGELIEFEPVPLDAPGSSDGPSGDDAYTDEAADSADEVLRQMSKLSPEAAEAIAAALNSPPASSTMVDDGADDGPDDDGPVTYLGTL